MPLTEVTKISKETPIPLMVEALESSVAWVLIRERIIRMRDKKNAELFHDPDITPAKAQRIMGYIEGLNRIVSSPHLLEQEWKAQIAGEQRAADQANRQRASLV